MGAMGAMGEGGRGYKKQDKRGDPDRDGRRQTADGSLFCKIYTSHNDFKQ